jgi:uncharacterized protein GlcG (DUF336 family)
MHRKTSGLLLGLVCWVLVAAVLPSAAHGQEGLQQSNDPACSRLPTAAQLRAFMQQAAANSPSLSAVLLAGAGGPGGLFGGTRMWAAVVNQAGWLCAYATSTNPRGVWPGSQAIAKAKAYTANGFSLSLRDGGFPLSTAQLYTFVQPSHSLFGLNQSNPFNPEFLAPPTGEGGGLGQIVGGIITFGGGVALYAGTQIIGGLGVSGDTACADHEIAKRVRDLAGLNPGGNPLLDDISYSSGPGSTGASVFTHPVCVNTFKNGVSIGQENAAAGAVAY